MIDGFSRDLRVALRRLVRSPGFSLAAVLTLALGIGANTTIFTLVNASLLRPLPFPDPERLVVLWERQRTQGKEQERVAAQNFLDWREHSRAFRHLAAWTEWGLALTGTNEPEELPAVRASSGLLQVLGVTPELGRGFLPEEEVPGRDRVVLLSHSLWSRRFARDSSVVGRTITLDGEPHTILGVMPADFRFPGDARVALWTPLAFDQSERANRAERRFNVIGRLQPGVSLDQAGSDLERIARRISETHPRTNAGWDVALVPAIEAAAAGSQRALAVLLGSVVLVLLIACGNVGHLLLVRAAEREDEVTLRVALGAAPARVIRLFLLESGLVAATGAALGVALSLWAVPLIQSIDPGMLPRWREPRIDTGVLLYSTGLLFFSALTCGLLPALHWTRRRLGSPLSAGARLSAGIRRSRLRQAIIVGEVALSVVLLLTTGLLLRSLARLTSVDPGFRPERVVSATIFLSPDYRKESDQIAFFDRLIERIEHLAGVEAVGAVTTLPMNPVGIDYDLPFSPTGQPAASEAEQAQVDFRAATSDYFRVLGMPLLAGRWFGAQDREDGSRVVIVDRTLARHYLGKTSPVGREVWIGGGIGKATVVGVVGPVRHRGLDELPRPQMYVPFRQYPHGGMTLVVRSAGDPAALAGSIKAQVYALDPDQPVSDLVALPELLTASVSPRRFTLSLVGTFAVFAVLLAALGIYSVIAYTVSQRRREIGIRVALGARSREVRRVVAGPGLGLTAAGVLLGSLLGWPLTRVLRSELYEVSPHDPVTFAAAGLLILLVAWAACELPVFRARRIDPAIALRSE
jgi:putative ABC transport system permease protein